MAHRRLYLTDAGAAFYRTRMLSAGDPITLSGPDARLQLKLGNVVETKPRSRAAQDIADDLAATPTPEPTTVRTGNPKRRRRGKAES